MQEIKDHVAALSLKPSAEVHKDVGAFVLQTGMSPAQLSTTAKICLSVGYRTDDMNVAIGSGLLLTVLGEQAVNERFQLVEHFAHIVYLQQIGRIQQRP